jgi:uncharacterized protein with PIN domain
MKHKINKHGILEVINNPHRKEHIIECPECNSPLEEVWQTFYDKYENEAEGMIGYKCKKCDVSYNREGDVI